jgi:hypothetical protein
LPARANQSINLSEPKGRRSGEINEYTHNNGEQLAMVDKRGLPAGSLALPVPGADIPCDAHTFTIDGGDANGHAQDPADEPLTFVLDGGGA